MIAMLFMLTVLHLCDGPPLIACAVSGMQACHHVLSAHSCARRTVEKLGKPIDLRCLASTFGLIASVRRMATKWGPSTP